MGARGRVGGPVVAVAAAMVVLGGCTDDAEPGDPAPTSSVAVAPGTATDGFQGARKDVTDLTCARDDEAWVSSGRVTNPLEVVASYRIYVSFLAPDGAALGVRQVDVGDVQPGEAREWDVEQELSTGDVECVLRVERTAQTE
ncbi:MAG: hypothetical protein ACLGIG_04245 [Actinomycetes bacterium]